MLGNIWQGTEKKELAAPYYARIVRNYPLSPLVPNAKSRLKALGAPVPQPDPQAVAWMTAEQNAPRQHESLIKKPLRLVKTGPDQELRAAAQGGKPTMTPESENEAGIDVLKGGNQTRITGPGSGIVAEVTPGGTGGTTGGGAENVAPTTEGTEEKPAAPPDPNAPPAAESSSNGASATGTSETAPKTDATSAAAGQPADAAKSDGATKNGTTDTNTKESTSKKKKGLKKLIPW
jgi:outer membrane protein assembly factor BamD